jgi:hypothetical protein
MERARHEKLHYMDLGTKDAPDYQLINEGVTDFAEAQNPETETRQYIADKTSRERVKRVQPSFSYTAVLNDCDPVSKYLYSVGADQKINTLVDIVHVDTWDADSDGKLVARKAQYNIIPENPGSGAGGDDLNMSGTISQNGDLIKGKWDQKDKIFTADKQAGQVDPKACKQNTGATSTPPPASTSTGGGSGA